LEKVQKGEMEKKGKWRKKQNRKTFFIHLFPASSFLVFKTLRTLRLCGEINVFYSYLFVTK